MSAKNFMLKNIDFKTLDFSKVTVEIKLGGTVIEGPPSKPLTAFPSGVRVQIVKADITPDYVVTFDAKVDNTIWKNVRSAPPKDPMFLLFEMLNINGGAINSDVFWLDGAPRIERSIGINTMDPLAEHQEKVAFLKKEGALLTRLRLYVGGNIGGTTFDEATMKKNLELYRGLITRNTTIEKCGDMTDANCKCVANFLGITYTA